MNADESVFEVLYNLMLTILGKCSDFADNDETDLGTCFPESAQKQVEELLREVIEKLGTQEGIEELFQFYSGYGDEIEDLLPHYLEVTPRFAQKLSRLGHDELASEIMDIVRFIDLGRKYIDRLFCRVSK